MTCFLILVPLAVGPAACGSDDKTQDAAPHDATAHVVLSIDEESRAADPDKPLEITARDDHRITDVRAVDAAGRRLTGELSADGTRWRSATPPAGATRYTVVVGTERGDGTPGRRTAEFTTRPAGGKKLTVDLGPENGTYGVGRPLTAELDQAIRSREQRAIVERALKVESTPAVEGSWRWMDDRTLHYRPRTYWPAHATITVRGALKGLWIRDGLRGAAVEPVRIRTGDRIEAVVDVAETRMTVRKNDKVLRTIPVTTGKPGFRTREGIKVVLGKQAAVRMTGTSIGIPEGSPESYDLPVEWATQLTDSGEFVHAAPWSAEYHGRENVSHGCTGMSTENARWFFETVRPGDIVRYVGGEGERMPVFGNGLGDWNLSWKEWREGSALHGTGA
ncbi:L,D-transpeptidase family protein [Streptomyces sp. TRM43335]|uniref:L,D-transpeptidase family protein n=1 Tax=Streptomyces taklimakanensis TaxID=2569853 RepID=A0A6G2B901_9ACTN|nr:Ig-like domain-containing protein [Streptomyces taklimakanensis]MTE18704.1 L,D-transpeptidase family protein [Streptomyces taklimakanensis]